MKPNGPTPAFAAENCCYQVIWATNATCVETGSTTGLARPPGDRRVPTRRAGVGASRRHHFSVPITTTAVCTCARPGRPRSMHQPDGHRSDEGDRSGSGRRIPETADRDLLAAADVVVSMGSGDACAIYPGKRYLDWTLDDPQGQTLETVRAIRDDLDTRVQKLLRELTTPVPARPPSASCLS